MTAALVILATMSVPLAAIISKAYLKSKQMSVQGQSGDVARLIAQNAELERRVQVLESIAIDDGTFLPEARDRVAVPPARVPPRLSA